MGNLTVVEWDTLKSALVFVLTIGACIVIIALASVRDPHE